MVAANTTNNMGADDGHCDGGLHKNLSANKRGIQVLDQVEKQNAKQKSAKNNYQTDKGNVLVHILLPLVKVLIKKSLGLAG